MILVTKFRVNDLTESLGAQVEFSARQNSEFWEFTEDECIVEIECRSLADASYKHTINALFKLSPSRGDYKNYLHQEMNLKKIFLDELHLTASSNSNDYFAIKKKPNGKYVLYYIPAEQLFSGFYEIAASDQIIVCEDSLIPLGQMSGRYGVKQLITYGAPGTGKSHKTKAETAAWEKENVFRTTFHPDSDYSTFVGAYKPTISGDAGEVKVYQGESTTVAQTQKTTKGISYEFVAQAFTKAYVKAWQEMFAAGDDENGKPKPNPVFLVIEEINRGNCAQIFGDLFQLLDRNEVGYSDYPIDADADLARHLAKAESLGGINGATLASRYGIDADIATKICAGKKMVLPPNLLIRATMNTSDQSLFPIDSAFKRRWEWEYVPILEGNDAQGNLLEWKVEFEIPKPTQEDPNAKESCAYSWWEFLQKVNVIIGSTTKSEDKKLGYFFVKADDNKKISAKKFLEKVIFYLWNDVFKDYGLDKIFADENGKPVEFMRFFDAKTGEIDNALIKEFIDHVMSTTVE